MGFGFLISTKFGANFRTFRLRASGAICLEAGRAVKWFMRKVKGNNKEQKALVSTYCSRTWVWVAKLYRETHHISLIGVGSNPIGRSKRGRGGKGGIGFPGTFGKSTSAKVQKFASTSFDAPVAHVVRATRNKKEKESDYLMRRLCIHPI